MTNKRTDRGIDRETTYFWEEVGRYLRLLIPEGASVLEVGYGRKAIADLREGERFDYIILRHGLDYFGDIQQSIEALARHSHAGTRLILIYVNRFWRPLLWFFSLLGMVRRRPEVRWVSHLDVTQALYLNDFEIVKEKHRVLMPVFVPLVSAFFNRYLINLPLVGKLAISRIILARPTRVSAAAQDVTVSVIVPCRNEKGNIEQLITRTPPMGKWTEIIFVEGHSQDGTLEECRRLERQYPERRITVAVQEGKGKGDAVRKGFSLATGDILMILDADLTVVPEDLPEFFNAMLRRKGEFINGSRLVYKMDRDAMRFLNFLANKFFSFAFTYLLEQRITDTLCGTKVLWRADYGTIAGGRRYFGDFDPFGDFDLLFGAAKLGLKIVDVPVRYRARTYGTTQISRFRDGWLLLRMMLLAARKIRFI